MQQITSSTVYQPLQPHCHSSALPPESICVQLRFVPSVGADHWAARRERLPSFVHFQRIRTACQRYVQVAAPYEAHGHGTPAAKNEP